MFSRVRRHQSTMSTTDSAEAVDALVEQADALCDIRNHITRVIAALDVPQDAFSDHYQPSTTDFDFESVVHMFLYQHARGFNDSELRRRLKGTTYLFIRFQLERPPTQQAIGYMWRRRLSLTDRRAIMATARA